MLGSDAPRTRLGDARGMTAGRVTEATARSRAAERRRYRMLIGGEWVDARSGETFESVDPFTGRPWADIPRAGPEDVDAAVRAARAAFDGGPWPAMPGTERARHMHRQAAHNAANAQ